jgi:hypothetical protein
VCGSGGDEQVVPSLLVSTALALTDIKRRKPHASPLVVGLKATTATLVIPHTDDCHAIVLGLCQAYKDRVKKEPGTCI